LLELLYRHNISYHPKFHRICCQGHILNLAAHAYLQCTEDDEIEGDTLTLADLAAWKKYGPLGQLHTFVVHRKRSPEQWQTLLQMTKGKAIPKDNKTRWNSYFYILEASLLPHVQQAIDRWFDKCPNDQPEDERLIEEDWEVIEKVY